MEFEIVVEGHGGVAEDSDRGLMRIAASTPEEALQLCCQDGHISCRLNGYYKGPRIVYSVPLEEWLKRPESKD